MARTKSEGLTPKQLEVLQLLQAGKHPREIAKKLKISPSGVYQHVRRIKESGIEIPKTPKKRGRPPGSGKKPVARIGLVKLGDPTPNGASSEHTDAPRTKLSLEDQIKIEIESLRDRAVQIEEALADLTVEGAENKARAEKLRKAHEALTA